MLKKINLVVFDFDGTLSAFDSNAQFIKYCFSHSLRPWFFLPLMIFLSPMKYINPGGIWWRELLRMFLTNDMIKKLVPGFIKQHKMNRFGWAAERVAAERSAGNKVILISAGPEYLIKKLVSDIKFDAVIASEYEKSHPWKFKSFVWGANKVVAMDRWAKENKFIPKLLRSYSDSKTDLPIMILANEQVWIDRKTGCRK